MKITSFLSRDDVRNMCIKHNLYTCGNSEEYTKLLDRCDVENIMSKMDVLESIATDIFNHSDIEQDGGTVNTIAWYICTECVSYSMTDGEYNEFYVSDIEYIQGVRL